MSDCSLTSILLIRFERQSPRTRLSSRAEQGDSQSESSCAVEGPGVRRGVQKCLVRVARTLFSAQQQYSAGGEDKGYFAS